MTFDNHDSRIKHFSLVLERDLEDIPEYPLPEGFRFVYYRPGDRETWMEIETSAKEFTTHEQGVAAWNKYFAAHEDILCDRMFFIENEAGEKIATVSAYIDITGRDLSGSGWVHWVAVRREYQGRGLSKPLVSRALSRLRELGYVHAKIPTQTTTWLACKVYLDLGFRPIPENAVNSRDGWRIIRTLTGHPALADFAPMELNEMLAENAAD